jgi:hypothetical protein
MQQAVEAYGAARCPGSHTVQIIGLQTAARPPTPHAGCTLPPEICYRPNKPRSYDGPGRIRCTEKNSMTTSGVEPATFRLIA